MDLRFLYVQWKDASYQDGPLMPHEMWGLKTLDSAGIFVQETDEYVTIAQDYSPNDQTYRNISHIPKVNIVKRKFLEMGKR